MPQLGMLSSREGFYFYLGSRDPTGLGLLYPLLKFQG